MNDQKDIGHINKMEGALLKEVILEKPGSEDGYCIHISNDSALPSHSLTRSCCP
jgi:hypothetical protein